MPKKTETREDGLPILLFEDSADWENWLERRDGDPTGVWMRIAKKAAPYGSVSYSDAVDVGLCHGWIDSQKLRYDEHSYLQKFTPRGPRSIWSKRNRERVERLEAEERMRPGGTAEVEAAKADGRWDAAYDSASTMEMPEDLERELAARPAARAFFDKLNGTNRYAVLFRIHTAKKPETRARRLAKFVEMLEKGETIYPQN